MKKALGLLAILVLCVKLQGEDIQPVKDGPIHEAFMVLEYGGLVLEAVPNQPPKDITELKPLQAPSEAEWIPGYWAWSRKQEEYLWVSGVWRHAPPGLQWISGYWKHYPHGWVWIRGFWSRIELEELHYVQESPPDQVDEKIQGPPESADSYFWVPGYWFYDTESEKYVWFSGRWEALSEQWIYTPVSYVWREKGYIFVGDFWDWPIEQRGTVYSAVHIDEDYIPLAVYEPKELLHPLFVVEQLFPYWPNYSLFYLHHYHFHHDEWVTWGAAPPWWSWPAWWGFTWPDLWWLWWWWAHPAYPNPSWINQDLANIITPPPELDLKLMKKIKPPANVTPNGVVGNQKLINALRKVTGRNFPILSSDPKQIEQVQSVANPVPDPSITLEPEGKSKALTPPIKPFFGPSKEEIKSSPRRLIVPSKPVVQQDMRGNPYHNARQGYIPNYEYPQTPMSIEHQDRMMMNPQPQRNPIEPKVNPLPGQETTVPYERRID